MYTFPHPQAIFDGGGELFIKQRGGSIASGTTTTYINFQVPSNFVLHLLGGAHYVAMGGTTGHVSVEVNIYDSTNIQIGRVYIKGYSYSTPTPSTHETFSLNLLLPSGYFVKAEIWNGTNATLYGYFSLYGILYAVFRS
jgi:hypothetical protein